jgi:hypothetical protein
MSSLYRKKLQKIYNRIDAIAQKGRDNFIEYYKYIDELVQKGDYAAFEQCLFYYYQVDITDFSTLEDVKRGTYDSVLFETTMPFLKKLKKIYDRKNVYQLSYDVFTTNPNVIQISLSEPYDIDVNTGSYSISGLSASIEFYRSSDIINVEVLDSDIYALRIYKADWNGITPSNIELLQRITVSTQSATYSTQIPTTYGREYLIQTEQRPNYKFLGYNLTLTKNTNLGQIKEVDTYSPDVKYLVADNQFASIIGARVTYLEVTKGGSSSTITTTNPNLSEEQNLLNRYSLAIDILNS